MMSLSAGRRASGRRPAALLRPGRVRARIFADSADLTVQEISQRSVDEDDIVEIRRSIKPLYPSIAERVIGEVALPFECVTIRPEEGLIGRREIVAEIAFEERLVRTKEACGGAAAVFRSLPDEAHPPPMDLLTVERMPEFHGWIETVERHASAGSGDCHPGMKIGEARDRFVEVGPKNRRDV
ncbi:hypothetical protein ACFYE9_31440 [Rhizobium leguminosarum]|uniref:Uncharacterized protein n=2 Tax=Rhizobium leguminosarum TaxID=384 RepID=A0ACD5FGW6_RHILE